MQPDTPLKANPDRLNSAAAEKKMTSSYQFRDYVGDWVAGTIGGCVGTVAAQPFDIVKARLQTEGMSGLKLRYQRMTKCFQIIKRTEGARGFYKGMTSPLIGQGIISLIVFGVEGNVQKGYIEHHLPPSVHPVISPFVSGMIAGFAQSFVCCPMDLIKIRVQHQGIGEKAETRRKAGNHSNGKTNRGPLAVIKTIYRAEGFAGYYRGMTATIWSDVIGYGVYFMTYENTRVQLKQLVFPRSDFFPSFIAGGLAGVCSWLASYPFEFVKARIQMDGEHGQRQYKGMINCFLKIYREEGALLYFKGLTPALLRAFVWSAAAFPAVELVKLQFSTTGNR